MSGGHFQSYKPPALTSMIGKTQDFWVVSVVPRYLLFVQNLLGVMFWGVLPFSSPFYFSRGHQGTRGTRCFLLGPRLHLSCRSFFSSFFWRLILLLCSLLVLLYLAFCMFATLYAQLRVGSLGVKSLGVEFYTMTLPIFCSSLFGMAGIGGRKSMIGKIGRMLRTDATDDDG